LTYTLAISYSNFQHIYGLPHITIAIVVKTSDIINIPKLITNDIVEKIREKSISNAFNPKIIQEIIHPFEDMIILKKTLLVNKPDSMKNDNPYERIIKSYYKLLDGQIKSDIGLSLDNIDQCILKLPMDKKGSELDKHEVKKQYSFALYNFPVVFQGENDSSGVLDLARLHANDIYMKERRKNVLFINAVLKNNLDIITQILRITWNSVPVEMFNDEFLGYPNLIIRENQQVKSQAIQPGDHFSFFPVAKYCIGPTAGVDEPIPTCIATSKRKPFGTILEGTSYELCSKCGGGKDSLSFLHRSRKDNKNISKVINEDIFRRIFLGEFALYVTNFNNIIKVGRSLKNRVVGRLLEQASIDALVFFPLPTYEFANDLEMKLKKFLKENISKLNCENVSDSIRQITRYENIKNINLNKFNNYEIYNNIIELLNNTDENNINRLIQLENRVLNFKNNWLLNRDIPSKYESIVNYKKIEGTINGTIGSFVMLNNKVYDFKNLYGYIGVAHD